MQILPGARQQLADFRFTQIENPGDFLVGELLHYGEQQNPTLERRQR